MIFQNNEIRDVGYESKMILENHIDGFLECTYRQVNGNEQYVYDITSKKCLKSFFDNKEIDYDSLCKIINGIVTGQQSVKEFLLNEEQLILDINYTYIDVESKKLFLCYCPYSCQVLGDQLLLLAEYILEKVDYTDDSATKLAYKLYENVLNGDYEFKKLITGNISKNEEEELKIKNITEENVEIFVEDEELYLPELNEEKNYSLPILGKSIISVAVVFVMAVGILFAATYIYKPYELVKIMKMKEMVLLLSTTLAMAMFLIVMVLFKWIRDKRKVKNINRYESKEDIELCRNIEGAEHMGDTENLENRESAPRLVKFVGNEIEEVLINKSPFVIGKKSSLCDGVLKNDAVSRMHAKVVKEGGSYYLSDLNSTNGTFLNGKRLTENIKLKLQLNDEIRFAQEAYYFR